MRTALPRNQAGFSALEAMLMMAILALATLGMAHTLLGGQQALDNVKQDTLIVDQARTLMSRLATMPFGVSGGPTPSALQLADLVAVENNLFGSSENTAGTGSLAPTQIYSGTNLSLSELRTASPISWQYLSSSGQQYYGHGGTWQMVVSNDLNGDGDLNDPNEGTSDLFRVDILYKGRRVLRTIRSKNPNE